MTAQTQAGGDSRLLATFLELVRIDSPSGAEAPAGRYVAEALAEAGMSVRFDDAEERTDSDSGNLIAELAGTADGLTIVLSGHMDTVEPGRGVEPVVADGIVRSSGRTILGGDDKAGLAAIIETVRRLRESGMPHPRLRVLVTVGEELGLQGAKALDPADAVGDLCLVLDADGTPGGIVVAAPTHFTFKATFEGVASHAGVEPEKGRSAVVMAAAAIAAMRIGRLDDETTANVGRIEGGGATNVVAESCVVTGECRSLDPAKAEAARDAMDVALRQAAENGGGSVRVLWTKEYDGFRFAEDDARLSLVKEACRDSGLEPHTFRTGGGSDGNVLTAKGLPSLVLAVGMHDVHGKNEWISVSDLEALPRLLLAVLKRATV